MVLVLIRAERHTGVGILVVVLITVHFVVIMARFPSIFPMGHPAGSHVRVGIFPGVGHDMVSPGAFLEGMATIEVFAPRPGGGDA